MTIAGAFAARAAKESVKTKRVPAVRGELFPIRLTPEPTAGDTFTIGVAFIDAAGIVRCRVAQDFSRLRCLYDDRVDIASFELLRDVVEADLSGTAWTSADRAPSENLAYGAPMPTAGVSVDEILNRAYDVFVPFGADRAAPGRMPAVPTDKLQESIKKQLVKLLGQRASILFSREPVKLPEKFGSGKLIRFPLHNRINGTAGDVVSAWSRNSSTVTHQLTRSVMNLLAVRCAEDRHGQGRQLGLFVLEPPPESNIAEKELSAIRNTISHMVAIAKGADVHVALKSSEAGLAEEIAQWRPLAA